MSRIPDGLGKLGDILENHVTAQVAIIHPDRYFYESTVRDFQEKYTTLIQMAFNYNSVFQTSLRKACGESAQLYVY